MPLESRRQSLAVRIGCRRAGWGREPRHTLVVTDEHASRTEGGRERIDFPQKFSMGSDTRSPNVATALSAALF